MDTECKSATVAFRPGCIKFSVEEISDISASTCKMEFKLPPHFSSSEQFDASLADKGFNIQDLLALHDTVLIAPPMMRKTNVSARASTATRRVATSGVHIERVIRRLKLTV